MGLDWKIQVKVRWMEKQEARFNVM